MNHRKILVIGYYHRKNLGDDVFEHVLTNFFQAKWPEAVYNFISIDDLKTIPSDTSLVIFGGGDLVNDYFFNKIGPFIKNKTCPWYAISIGIPYPALIAKGYLDRFDYIIHRNYTDHLVLSEKYNIKTDIKTNIRTEWFPDMSFMLPHYNTMINPINPITSNVLDRYSKKIGIFLSRSIYNPKYPSDYQHIISNLAMVLSKISLITHQITIPGCGTILVPTYQLYLMPFCTDGKDTHDDRLINEDVYHRMLDYGSLDNVFLNNDRIYMDKLNSLFDSFHLTICTRFHAHMFSLMSKVPILSIYTTRKVENLLKELEIEGVKMKVDYEKNCPVSVDPTEIWDKFRDIIDKREEYITKFTRLYNLYKAKTVDFMSRLDNLIFYGPRYILPDEIDKITREKVSQIASKLLLLHNNPSTNIHMLLNERINELTYVTGSNDFYVDLIDKDDIIYKNGIIGEYFKDINPTVLVEIISYELTGIRISVYNYGLSEQILTPNYNLYESCKWIIDNKYQDMNHVNFEFIDNIKFPLVDRKLNITHINNDLFHGYHRSGWSYVLKNIEELHNPKGVIFDSYLDKTFGWEYDFLSFAQVIPYQKKWVGVFHHTANQDYTENNLANVFSKDKFIQSLDYCQGIIVLSDYNKEWIANQLVILGKNIPILSLVHPTELLAREYHFSYDLYIKNPVKKVIQIGAWLRNTYAIYDLKIPANIYKFALKGKDMNNYFISDDNFDLMLKNIKAIASGEMERNSASLIENKKANKYMVGLVDMITEKHKSVMVLDKVTNNQYDELLKCNLVFINLVDASAVNTILECIVRNTPIIVNRLPSTLQYLGEDYPLFYENYDEVEKLLTPSNIKNAVKYLECMDKSIFTIEYFINSLINSELYQNL